MNASAKPGAPHTGLATGAASGTARRRIVLIAEAAAPLLAEHGDLIGLLARQGHELLCLLPESDVAAGRDIEALGARMAAVALPPHGLRPLEAMASVRALRAQMHAFGPDIVALCGPRALIYGAIAAGRARVARIVPLITGLAPALLGAAGEGYAAQTIARSQYARALRHCHAAIFHTREDREQLRAANLLPAGVSTCLVGGSGVDLTAFEERPLPPTGDGLTFLMIAPLQRRQGVLEFCQAAREVRATAPAARFVLVDDGSQSADDAAAELRTGWSGDVEVLEPPQDVRVRLAACHVYVQPGHDGVGVPRPLLQALATGRPVVTPATRGCRETVDEVVNGRLVAAGDAQALAAAMRAMIEQARLLPALARASRQKAERRFDAATITRTLAATLLAPPAAGRR